jgi:hypothetical protein
MQEIRDITTEIWPSARAMADAIGVDYETARKWFQRGRIPDRHWPALIEKSATSERPLTAEQLLNFNRPRKKRRRPNA